MRSLRVPTLAVAAVVLTMGTVAGCTPASEPILGLALRDGRPAAVLVPCGSVATVSLYPGEGSSADPDLSWSARTTAAAGVTELVLLAAPPSGWEGAPSAATLEPGVRYHLSGSSDVEARIVRFTTADLATVGADQVLVPDGDDIRLVTRADFESEARESCP